MHTKTWMWRQICWVSALFRMGTLWLLGLTLGLAGWHGACQASSPAELSLWPKARALIKRMQPKRILRLRWLRPYKRHYKR